MPHSRYKLMKETAGSYIIVDTASGNVLFRTYRRDWTLAHLKRLRRVERRGPNPQGSL